MNNNKTSFVRIPKLIHELAKNIAAGRDIKISAFYNEAFNFWFSSVAENFDVAFDLFPKPPELPTPPKNDFADEDDADNNSRELPQAFNSTSIAPELYAKLKDYCAAFPNTAEWRIQTCVILAYINAHLFRPKNKASDANS